MNTIQIKDYTYDLPGEKIALFPLSQRDQSKLLVFRDGNISHRQFYNLSELLPANSLLFLNDTKVIPARLHFTKDTGAQIEIFLLNPHEPGDVHHAMQSAGKCSWKCMIGNLKRWKQGMTLKKSGIGYTINATLTDLQENIVEFSWPSSDSFAEVIHLAGETPLPPYIHRKPEKEDTERYQTVYSHHEGAVAAPTAGLHFTGTVMQALKNKGIMLDFLTLHVGAGTFQPVKTGDALKHIMHEEQIIVKQQNLENLLEADKFTVSVGTTSVRTLESIYWYGVKLSVDPEASFNIGQNDPYLVNRKLPSAEEALGNVLSYMKRNALTEIRGNSSIYIVPGYSFKICDALITNFHQPGSTLMLLVAAFIGNDWKKIYQEALSHNYRFLSYGDSSLLIPKRR